MRISEEEISGGKKIVNKGFGNRCSICGSHFDQAGVCNNGHEQNRTYYYLPETEKEKKIVVCEVFNGCRCTLCGAFFADGDDVCANGHEIGQKYFQ